MDHITTNTDAVEFGLHVKQGGWRLGLLVARNVEKGTQGGDRSNPQPRIAGKVTGEEFARQSGTSGDRVLRYLNSWNKAAEQGHVPPSSELSPGQNVDLDVDSLPDWSTFYSNNWDPRRKELEKQKIKAAEDDARRKAAEEYEAKLVAERKVAEAKAAKVALKAEEDKRKALAEQQRQQEKELEAERKRLKQEKLEALGRLEKQLRDEAANHEFDPATFTQSQKHEVMTLLANDPDEAKEWFRARDVERKRRIEETHRKAKEQETKRKEQMEERERRLAAERASKEYKDSSLHFYLTKVVPVLAEFEKIRTRKPITMDHVITSDETLRNIVELTEKNEDTICAFREQVFIVNAELEIKSN